MPTQGLKLRLECLPCDVFISQRVLRPEISLCCRLWLIKVRVVHRWAKLSRQKHSLNYRTPLDLQWGSGAIKL